MSSVDKKAGVKKAEATQGARYSILSNRENRVYLCKYRTFQRESQAPVLDTWSSPVYTPAAYAALLLTSLYFLGRCPKHRTGTSRMIDVR